MVLVELLPKKPKSLAAQDAIIAMNPDLKGKVVAKQDRVGQDTERNFLYRSSILSFLDIFNDAFWESLDCVTNALDNVDARTPKLFMISFNPIAR